MQMRDIHKWDRSSWLREMRAHDKVQRMEKFYKEMKLLAIQKDSDRLSAGENH